MRIAVFSLMFPAWTETFVRREVEALHKREHVVKVFTIRKPEGPPTDGISGVDVQSWTSAGSKALQEFAPDVIYAEMGYDAQRVAMETAASLKVPCVLRLWSGLDSLGLPDACKALYRNLKPETCRGVIVEDAYMAGWARCVLGIPENVKVTCVPNSLPLGRAVPDEKRRQVFFRDKAGKRSVLAVGRLVQKKGFTVLARAYRELRDQDGELWLVGDGKERSAIAGVLSFVPGARMFGAVREEDLWTVFYPNATMLVAPCVPGNSGDADLIPTVVLEAMSAGLPVIASDLLSMSAYVRNGETGLLVPPGDVLALRDAMKTLLSDAGLRTRLGNNGREWAEANLDVEKNILKIEEVMAA